MKIERISENQIRCTLNKADLAGNETLLNELAFGSEKAHELFHQLMDQASKEVGFEINDNPLMVEAIPVSKECLVLVITKVDDSKDFSKRYETLANGARISSQKKSPSQLMNFLENLVGSKTEDDSNMMELALSDSSCEIFSFSNLDEVATASKLIANFPYESQLYKDKENQCYYLCLTCDDNNFSFSEIQSTLAEYSKPIMGTYATKALFNEHMQLMIDKDAIQKLCEF